VSSVRLALVMERSIGEPIISRTAMTAAHTPKIEMPSEFNNLMATINDMIAAPSATALRQLKRSSNSMFMGG